MLKVGKIHAFLILSLALAVFVHWLGYKKPVYGIDDANIYFVYMRNFAEGNGFVWTVGGEHVEGFTSFLWTIIGSLFYKISPAYFPVLLFILNFILTFFTLLRTVHFIRALNGIENRNILHTDILLVAILFLPLGFIEWSILTLMETGLWMFLIVNSILLLGDSYLKGKPVNTLLFCFCISGLVLTRPEGLLLAFVFVLLFFISAYIGNIKRALSETALPFAVYIASAAGLIGWRLYYFGYPFPNTYYAKVSGNIFDNLPTGGWYVFKFFYAYPHWAFLFAFLFIVVALLLKKFWQKRTGNFSANEKIQLLLTAILVVVLLIPVYSGGDHFKYSRFYQGMLPVALIALFNFPAYKHYFYSNAIARPMKTALTFCTVFTLLFIAKSSWFDFKLEPVATGNKIFEDFDIARKGRTIADSLNTMFISKNLKPRVGVIAAGGFGYNYKGETVDLMGLNNTLIAHMNKRKQGPRNHAAFDKKAFWLLQPDILGTFYGAELTKEPNHYLLNEKLYTFEPDQFTYKAYKGIFDDPDFILAYQPALVQAGQSDYLFAYYNRSFLSRLDTSHFKILPLGQNISGTLY